MKIAVFPGSFDPITVGHESIISRAADLFDKLIIAIGYNSDKNGFFTIEQRIEWLETVFAEYDNIVIDSYTGLTVDYCKKVNANYILRGLRTSADFEFERSIGQTNKKLLPEIETIFMLTQPEHTMINSSVVRDVLRHNGNADQFVPDSIDLSKGIRI
jgi:pantetheine-phosphate adenylyltransferase